MEPSQKARQAEASAKMVTSSEDGPSALWCGYACGASCGSPKGSLIASRAAERREIHAHILVFHEDADFT